MGGVPFIYGPGVSGSDLVGDDDVPPRVLGIMDHQINVAVLMWPEITFAMAISSTQTMISV